MHLYSTSPINIKGTAMLTMLTAHTFEVDDVDGAVAEILEQLDLENKLCKNAVGILTCYSEFLETGVVKAVCDSLPFEVVGCTTMASGTPQQSGAMILALSVITSDTVAFATTMSAPLVAETYFTALEEAFTKAAGNLPDKPSMIIPFLPIPDTVTNDSIVDALNTISSELPIFGTLGSDHTTDYNRAHIIHNGEDTKESMALLLMSGPISPRFHMVSIPEEKRQKQNAIITSSQGNIVHRVNDMPLLQYLETIGFCNASNIETAKIVPFIVNYNDGTTPVVRGIYYFTPEGSAVFSGHMPCNATLSIGSLDYSDVITSTKALIAEVNARKDASLMLIFSCICRGWTLGTDMLAELDCVQETTERIPYLMCYSGGEISPVYNEQDVLFNRFHCYTCIICTL